MASRVSVTSATILLLASLVAAGCNSILGIGDHSLYEGTSPDPGSTGGSGNGAPTPGDPSEASGASPAPTPSSSSADGGGSAPGNSQTPSICGNPGDPGNTMGIGRYCDGANACTGAGTFCSDVADPDTHFCTASCSPDAGGGGCGENAACAEEDGVTVCVPNACLAATGASDAGAPSLCGNPGDHGNTEGVGMYCNSSADCTSSISTLCSNLGNPDTHFCTQLCSLDAGGGGCAEMATCVLEEGVAVCVPDSCLARLEDGG